MHFVKPPNGLILALGWRFTFITVSTVPEHPVFGYAVSFKFTKPNAISSADGVKIGVSVESLLKIPGVAVPVVFVQRIEPASETVTKSGNVKVSAHIVVSFWEATMLGFLLIKIVIASVAATCVSAQAALGRAEIVNVTEEVSAEPKL